jgi:DNA-binding response OmpR family regulator
MTTDKQVKIMIADDDAGIVDAVEMMLDYKGYQVRTATENTLKRITEELPDVLLLDIWMSGEDGIEVCKALKSNETTMHIPVIMISASKDIENSALKAGANDFLPKPFEMNVLIEKIERFLKG